MSPGRKGYLRRWGTFLLERFVPLSHLALIGAYFTGNAAVGGVWVLSGPVSLTAFAVTVLIFLRLRIFDEIKDYDTDLKLNPGRPLARGLISTAEARWTAFGIAGIEAVLAATAGRGAFGAWTAAFLFSLLMYREFFCGGWLRPRMELYAVLHTLSAGWTGLFIAAAVTRGSLAGLSRPVWIFFLANWGVFNLYEFARKTLGRDEDREGRESYSARLGPGGAALLGVAMAWSAVALALAALTSGGVEIPLPGAWAALMILPAAGGVFYSLDPRRGRARIYRSIMTSYIFLFYGAAAAAVMAR